LHLRSFPTRRSSDLLEAHLPSERIPPEDQRRARLVREIARLRALIIRMEHEPALVERAEQHHARGRLAARAGGRERHGVRLVDAAARGGFEPFGKERNRIDGGHRERPESCGAPILTASAGAPKPSGEAASPRRALSARRGTASAAAKRLRTAGAEGAATNPNGTAARRPAHGRAGTSGRRSS